MAVFVTVGMLVKTAAAAAAVAAAAELASEDGWVWSHLDFLFLSSESVVDFFVAVPETNSTFVRSRFSFSRRSISSRWTLAKLS